MACSMRRITGLTGRHLLLMRIHLKIDCRKASMLVFCRRPQMKARIPLTILVVDKLAISVGGMREAELFGASDVIGEDTVANASLLGEIDNATKKMIPKLVVW